MPQDNLSAPFSMTTSALVGAPSSILSGLVIGTKHAGRALTNGSDLFSENASKRNSLLAALDALYVEQKAVADIPGLNLFPAELKEAFEASANGIGSVVSRALVMPTGLLSNLTQIPLDLSTAIHAVLSSVEDPKKFTRQDASTLNAAEEVAQFKSGFSAHCQALTKEMDDIIKKLNAEIKENVGEGDFARVHVSAGKSSAYISSGLSVSVAGFISAGLDVIGSVFRESTALKNFSQIESKSEGEKNIYLAIQDCSKAFSESQNSEASLQSLRKLEAALSHFADAQKIAQDHVATAPSISVFVRSLLSETFLGALRGVNSSAIALSAASKKLNEQQDRFTNASNQTIPRASSINDAEGAPRRNHSQNLSDLTEAFGPIIAELEAAILLNDQKSDRGSIATSAVSTAGLASAFTAIPLLVTDFVGLMSREISGAVDFTRNDKGVANESKQVSATRKDQTGADLDALMARVSQLKERLERCEKLGVSAPVTLGISHIVSCGALIGTLNSMLGMSFALSELKSVSHQDVTKLDEEEKRQANESKDSVIASNKKSAASTGAESLSQNLSLNDRLQSVMEKVVLLNRSKLNFLQPGMERNDLNSTAKSTVAFSQGNSTGFLSGALGTLALVALESGIGIEAFFHSLSLGCIQADRLSDGVDNIKTGAKSRSNFSAISNATRLSAEKSKSSAINFSSHVSHHVAESLGSRSLVVALCHSGALSAALRLLYAEEKAQLQHHAHFLDSALVSAGVMDKLADKILAVLNQADNLDRPMPGLNVDMASQLASVSKAGIITALSVHSSLISPFLQSFDALQDAKRTAAIEKDEALSGTIVSHAISMSLNTIQAFTKNCIREFKHNSEEQHNQPPKNMSSTHLSANESFAGFMVSLSGITLLFDELIEISLGRSFSLLNKAVVQDCYKDVSKETRQESKDSTQRVADDSESGKSESATRIVSALRLTLSHLGHSIVRLAKAMHEECEADKFVQDDLLLHSSQKTLMQSVVTSFSNVGTGLLQLSGIISMLPMSSAGFVDDIRQCIHEIDPKLQFHRVQTSAHTTRHSGSDDSSLITGLATDAIADIVVNLSKLLMRGTLIGSDIALSISKILEVFTLHHRPEQAFSLEMQEFSMPNGLSKNIQTQSKFATVGASVASAIIFDESKRSHECSESTVSSNNSAQKIVNDTIDGCTLLFDEDDNSINLKMFYEVLIRVLAQHEHLAGLEGDNCKDLANRLHRGGIALSSYHSNQKGVPGAERAQDEKRVNPLIQNNLFLGCDDAGSLLDCFVRKATANELSKAEGQLSLLQILKNELMPINKPVSHRAKEAWTFVVDKISDNLYLKEERSMFFRPRNERRTAFDKDAFFQGFTEGVREYQPDQVAYVPPQPNLAVNVAPRENILPRGNLFSPAIQEQKLGEEGVQSPQQQEGVASPARP